MKKLTSEQIAVSITEPSMQKKLEIFRKSLPDAATTSVDLTPIYIEISRRLRDFRPRRELSTTIFWNLMAPAIRTGLSPEEVNRQFASIPDNIFSDLSKIWNRDAIKAIFPVTYAKNGDMSDSISQFYFAYVISISSISDLAQLILAGIEFNQGDGKLTETSFLSVAGKFANELREHPPEWIFQLEAA